MDLLKETLHYLKDYLRINHSSLSIQREFEQFELLLHTTSTSHLPKLLEQSRNGDMISSLLASKYCNDYGSINFMLKKATEQGSGIATFLLASFYCGNKSNFHNAFKYFKIAAQRGLNESEYVLGKYYHNGIGCESDMDQAMKWYKIAAKKNHPKALRRLGCFYRDQGNTKLAILFFEKAYNLQDIEASYHLGLLLIKQEHNDDEDGKCKKKGLNKKKGLKLIKRYATNCSDCGAYYVLAKYWSNKDNQDYNIRKSAASMIECIDLAISDKLPLPPKSEIFEIFFKSNMTHYLSENKTCQWIYCRKNKQENTNNNLKWYKCRKCVIVYYCSKKCQKLDWNRGYHKKFCGSPFVEEC